MTMNNDFYFGLHNAMINIFIKSNRKAKFIYFLKTNLLGYTSFKEPMWLFITAEFRN